MKPHARNYIFPAILLVFGLNKLLIFILPKVGSDYETIMILVFTIIEVAISTLLTAMFFTDSKKYDRDNRNQNNKQ